MEDEIVRKLRKALSDDFQKDSDVLYVMVQVRKLLELDRMDKAPEYETLNFYCDWVTHPVMDRSAAKRMLLLFEGQNEVDLEKFKSRTEREARLSYETSQHQLNFLSFNTLNEQLNNYLKQKDVGVIDGNRWPSFEKILLGILIDTPLRSNQGDIEEFSYTSEPFIQDPPGGIHYKIQFRTGNRKNLHGTLFKQK
jgi:hypothetical protein